MDLKEGMIAMKDGRVMTVQSGEMKLVEEDATMEDGTRVSMDGMLSLKDGTTRKMREGETLYPGSKPPESTTMPHMEDTEEMTLSDGTRIGIDGTVVMPDGSTRMMEEGENITLGGVQTQPEQMSDRQFKENMEDEELRDDIK